MNKKDNSNLVLVLIFILALVLRLGYLLFLKNHYFFFGHPSDDVTYYQQWAESIAFGDWLGEKTFSGMPLFPYYLAVLFRLCFGSWLAVGIFNIILGAFNCVLVYILAKKIFSDRCALIAGVLTATHFVLIYYDWLMMPITLLITLTLLILLALSTKPQTSKEWFILGLILGLASLGDGNFLITSVLIIFFLLWYQTPLKISKTILPITLGLILILGGVTVRNKIVSGDWVFITSQSGLSLYVGNNPEATGVFENPEFIRPTHGGQDEDQRIFVENVLQKKVTPAEVSHYYKQKALSFITEHPAEYAKLLAKKFIQFFSDNEEAHDIDMLLQRDLKFKLDLNPFWVICPLALLGIFLSWREKKESAILILVIISKLIFCLIYFVTTRHRAPILPLLIIFEAYTITWAIDKLRAKKYIPVLATIFFLIIFFFTFPPRYLKSEALAFLTYSKAGPILDQHKEFKKAEAAYFAALSLRPGDTNTVYNLATSYMNEGDFDKAKFYFLKALDLCHFNVDALFNLGYVYEKTGEPEKALASYENVLKYQTDSLDARYRIANLYQTQGECQKAQPYYEEIIRRKPSLTAEIRKLFSQCK